MYGLAADDIDVVVADLGGGGEDVGEVRELVGLAQVDDRPETVSEEELLVLPGELVEAVGAKEGAHPDTLAVCSRVAAYVPHVPCALYVYPSGVVYCHVISFQSEL